MAVKMHTIKNPPGQAATLKNQLKTYISLGICQKPTIGSDVDYIASKKVTRCSSTPKNKINWGLKKSNSNQDWMVDQNQRKQVEGHG